MNEQEKFEKLFRKHPHPVATFSEKPHLTRRRFFNMAGMGVTASYLASKLPASTVIQSTPVQAKNTAKNVIFILLAGAPSHTDTFDLKVVPGTTPDTFKPDTHNGILFPTGLMPNLAGMMDDFAIVRSMQSWALVHSLSQTWTQIGRNPAGVLGNVSPNIGSVVAIEKNGGADCGAGVSDVSGAEFKRSRGSRLFPGVVRAVQGDAIEYGSEKYYERRRAGAVQCAMGFSASPG